MSVVENGDAISRSLNRSRMSPAVHEADKRSSSLYSSVRVSKGGFSRFSNNTSVMTPYTNIGGEMSRYGGKNRTLKQWYEGKVFPHGARTSGFALNKCALGQSQQEIYSQFSASESGQGDLLNSS